MNYSKYFNASACMAPLPQRIDSLRSNILGYSAAVAHTLCTQREDGDVNAIIARSYSRSALGKAPSTDPASRPVAFHAEKFQ
jgi:hypothetical protein